MFLITPSYDCRFILSLCFAVCHLHVQDNKKHRFRSEPIETLSALIPSYIPVGMLEYPATPGSAVQHHGWCIPAHIPRRLDSSLTNTFIENTSVALHYVCTLRVVGISHPHQPHPEFSSQCFTLMTAPKQPGRFGPARITDSFSLHFHTAQSAVRAAGDANRSWSMRFKPQAGMMPLYFSYCMSVSLVHSSANGGISEHEPIWDMVSYVAREKMSSHEKVRSINREADQRPSPPMP